MSNFQDDSSSTKKKVNLPVLFIVFQFICRMRFSTLLDYYQAYFRAVDVLVGHCPSVVGKTLFPETIRQINVTFC